LQVYDALTTAASVGRRLPPAPAAVMPIPTALAPCSADEGHTRTARAAVHAHHAGVIIPVHEA
jgi:hypothetical protein